MFKCHVIIGTEVGIMTSLFLQCVCSKTIKLKPTPLLIRWNRDFSKLSCFYDQPLQTAAARLMTRPVIKYAMTCIANQGVFTVYVIMAITSAVVGCGSNAKRDKGRGFFRIPSVIKTHGKKIEVLSKKRRQQWLNNISCSDLTESKIANRPTRVCGNHFVEGISCIYLIF